MARKNAWQDSLEAQEKVWAEDLNALGRKYELVVRASAVRNGTDPDVAAAEVWALVHEKMRRVTP